VGVQVKLCNPLTMRATPEHFCNGLPLQRGRGVIEVYCCQCRHNRVLRKILIGVVVSVVGLINEVSQCWARLVLGWVTVLGRVNHLGV